MVPAMASSMPGLELTLATAAVPLLNVALLIKAVVLGTATWGQVFVVLASIFACIVVTLIAAARAFTSEALRFGGAESWRDVFGLGPGATGPRAR
jgi:sodium transport system permease protein